MSYARFRADESDVYVFHHYAGFIECCGCHLTEPDVAEEIWGYFKAQTAREILEHPDLHRSVGNLVPERAYDRIKEEYPDLDAQIEPYVQDPEREAKQKARLKEIFGKAD